MNGANYAIDEHGMGQIEDQIRMICGLNVNTHSLQRICQQIKFNNSHKRRHDSWKRIHQLFNNAILSAIKAVLLIDDIFSFRFLFLTNDFIFMRYVILFNCFLIHTVKVERVIPYALV